MFYAKNLEKKKNPMRLLGFKAPWVRAIPKIGGNQVWPHMFPR
jgi:hypothetical protein